MIVAMMNLRDFLKELGDSEAADLLDVPQRTVASWRRGERIPRPHQAARIVRLTHGRVDYAGIYAPTPTDEAA